MKTIRLRVAGTVSAVCLAMALLAGIGGQAVAAPAAGTTSSTCDRHFQVIPSPSPGTISNWLSNVLALSSNDAWAVGTQVSAPNDVFTATPLGMHWDGYSWTEVQTAGHFQGSVSALYANSPTDIWATAFKQIGFDEAYPAIERWNGSSWKLVPSAQIPLGYLFDVSGTGPHDIWAVGIVRGIKFQTLIEHYDGHAWTVVESPEPDTDYLTLSGVAAVAPDDVWAVGNYLDRNEQMTTLLMHFDGSAWSRSVRRRPPVSGI
jgi:hypothetical protein